MEEKNKEPSQEVVNTLPIKNNDSVERNEEKKKDNVAERVNLVQMDKSGRIDWLA